MIRSTSLCSVSRLLHCPRPLLTVVSSGSLRSPSYPPYSRAVNVSERDRPHLIHPRSHRAHSPTVPVARVALTPFTPACGAYAERERCEGGKRREQSETDMIRGKTVSDRDLSQQQPTLDEEFRDNRCLETTRWKVRPKIRRLERSEEQRIGGITVVSFPAPADDGPTLVSLHSRSIWALSSCHLPPRSPSRYTRLRPGRDRSDKRSVEPRPGERRVKQESGEPRK